MRSTGTSEASISSLSSASAVPRLTTSLTRLASLRLGNILAFSGLARTRRARANRVADPAARNMPPPTASPTAATAQMLAAVVSPLTTSLRRMIVPAPIKPMPLATCAATREGSRITWRSLRMSENPKIETTMNIAEPSDTRAWVLIPAAHSNRSRSKPTRPPRTAATTSRKIVSCADIIPGAPPFEDLLLLHPYFLHQDSEEVTRKRTGTTEFPRIPLLRASVNKGKRGEAMRMRDTTVWGQRLSEQAFMWYWFLMSA